MAGPITRAPLNIEEFSAIAFIRSSLPTMSTRNDCRARNIEGIYHAEQRGQHKHVPHRDFAVNVSAASTKARTIEDLGRNHDPLPVPRDRR